MHWIAVNKKTAAWLFCPSCTFSTTLWKSTTQYVDYDMLWSRSTLDGLKSHNAKISYSLNNCSSIKRERRTVAVNGSRDAFTYVYNPASGWRHTLRWWRINKYIRQINYVAGNVFCRKFENVCLGKVIELKANYSCNYFPINDIYCHKTSTLQTDGQTDGRTDAQLTAAIARSALRASHSKNNKNEVIWQKAESLFTHLLIYIRQIAA